MDLLKVSATLTLAELWLALGSSHAKRALSLIHGAFPMILGHGGLELRARAYIFEAKCYLSDPSFSGVFALLLYYCFISSRKNYGFNIQDIYNIHYILSSFSFYSYQEELSVQCAGISR